MKETGREWRRKRIPRLPHTRTQAPCSSMALTGAEDMEFPSEYKEPWVQHLLKRELLPSLLDHFKRTSLFF